MIFSFSDVSKNYILTFLGVTPCVDLYINGIFVGYGEGSHNSYEFDVTDTITPVIVSDKEEIFVGETFDVLLSLNGFTDNYIPVKLKGEYKINELYKVTLTKENINFDMEN
mgnify:CR=1 FL=1